MIDDLQGFAHIVIGDEDGEVVLLAQLLHDLVNVAHGDGIDAGKRFVEHEQARICAKSSRDRQAALFATGERQGTGFAQARDAKALHELCCSVVLLPAAEVFARLEHA